MSLKTKRWDRLLWASSSSGTNLGRLTPSQKLLTRKSSLKKTRNTAKAQALSILALKESLAISAATSASTNSWATPLNQKSRTTASYQRNQSTKIMVRGRLRVQRTLRILRQQQPARLKGTIRPKQQLSTMTLRGQLILTPTRRRCRGARRASFRLIL